MRQHRPGVRTYDTGQVKTPNQVVPGASVVLPAVVSSACEPPGLTRFSLLRGGLPACGYGGAVAEEIHLTIVSMVLDASDPVALQPILAKYVVLSRGHPGCRNIDLCASATTPGRFLIIQKWDDPDSQRAHFDSPEMVEMASACRGLLAHPPTIDLYEPISAHDLN